MGRLDGSSHSLCLVNLIRTAWSCQSLSGRLRQWTKRPDRQPSSIGDFGIPKWAVEYSTRAPSMETPRAWRAFSEKIVRNVAASSRDHRRGIFQVSGHGKCGIGRQKPENSQQPELHQPALPRRGKQSAAGRPARKPGSDAESTFPIDCMHTPCEAYARQSVLIDL